MEMLAKSRVVNVIWNGASAEIRILRHRRY